MAEVVNVVVAFVVIVFLFRWVTSSKDSPGGTAETLGFRPKNVTDDMINTIHGMFPDIPVDNIRYDLLRTGDVEMTTNKILEKGFLDAPPAPYYTLYPRAERDLAAAPAPPAAGAGATATAAKENLISRYNLQDRVTAPAPTLSETQIGGKAVWEDSAEKREASLRERKAQLILAARQRLLASQQQQVDSTASTSTS
jgi:coupling of ubiquitin conjugation to ER degradation protein 1